MTSRTAVWNLEAPVNFDTLGGASVGVDAEGGTKAILEVLRARAHVVHAVVKISLHVFYVVACCTQRIVQRDVKWTNYKSDIPVIDPIQHSRKMNQKALKINMTFKKIHKRQNTSGLCLELM